MCFILFLSDGWYVPAFQHECLLSASAEIATIAYFFHTLQKNAVVINPTVGVLMMII